MRNRWSTGWVLLPGTPKFPQTVWHRPHPDDPDRTVCGRSCKGVPVKREGTPKKRARHDLCELRAEEARDREQRAAQRDHDEREEGAGSVRALRGGLPGLGRRR